MKIITNKEYARLKDLAKVAERLQADLYGSLSFERQTELLIKIGTDTHKYAHIAEDANIILKIGKKWMEDITSSYHK